jgi:hypothetical protein
MNEYPVRTVYYLDQVITASNAEEAYLKADRAELDETTLDRLGLTFVDRETVSESQAL